MDIEEEADVAFELEPSKPINLVNVTEYEVMVVFNLLKKNNFSVIFIYTLLFVVGLVANLLLIIVIFKYKYVMQNVTNYFLVNLSVADLLVTCICMPSTAWHAYTDAYIFGSFACKMSSYLQGIAVASSIFTITAMSIDRYLAIMRPFSLSYRCYNRTNTLCVIGALWGFSLVLFSPNLWIADLVQVIPNSTIEVYMCRMASWSSVPIGQNTLGILWFTCMFAVPGIIMTAAYTTMGKTLCSVLPPMDNNEPACTQQRNKLMRSRRRVACILLLLAFVFGCCWLPYHIINLVVDLTGMRLSSTMENATIYLLLLGHINSALNPIIYCALSKNFRKSIRHLLCESRTRCRTGRLRPRWMDRTKEVPLAFFNPKEDTITTKRQSQKLTKTCTL